MSLSLQSPLFRSVVPCTVGTRTRVPVRVEYHLNSILLMFYFWICSELSSTKGQQRPLTTVLALDDQQWQAVMTFCELLHTSHSRIGYGAPHAASCICYGASCIMLHTYIPYRNYSCRRINLPNGPKRSIYARIGTFVQDNEVGQGFNGVVIISNVPSMALFAFGLPRTGIKQESIYSYKHVHYILCVAHQNKSNTLQNSLFNLSTMLHGYMRSINLQASSCLLKM
jgi:hypothetical protein